MTPFLPPLGWLLLYVLALLGVALCWWWPPGTLEDEEPPDGPDDGSGELPIRPPAPTLGPVVRLSTRAGRIELVRYQPAIHNTWQEPEPLPVGERVA